MLNQKPSDSGILNRFKLDPSRFSAAAKPEIVPSLFVMNSRGATLQGDTLVLIGVTPSSIIFADRPVRAAGHQPTADVIVADRPVLDF
jgi:hypothetical protein